MPGEIARQRNLLSLELKGFVWLSAAWGYGVKLPGNVIRKAAL